MKSIFFISFLISAVFACENDSKLKYVNEKCAGASDCYNGNNAGSISCQNGRCTCSDNYVPQLQWFAPNDQRLVCVNAPYENQQCTTICQKPYQCVAVDKSVKMCQCAPPYRTQDFMCILDCQADEVFENGVCQKRCAENENDENGSGCKKMSPLGGPCVDKNQCTTPYSMCISNICVCGYGFAANSKKDGCVEKDTQRWCPLGSPIRTAGNLILECQVTKVQPIPLNIFSAIVPFRPPSTQLTDQCGPNQFCMLTSGESSYVEGASGHCCPKPVVSCPLGLPHPNATCGDVTPIFRADSTQANAPFCPFDTHSCIQYSFGGSYQISLCCPTACALHEIYDRDSNFCYPVRDYGDRCQIDAQCKAFNGICDQRKRCSCGPGYVLNGGVSYQYCQRVCKDNEVLFGTDCAPKLNLGDRCNPTIFNQCPLNAYCDNNRKVCDCYCGYAKLEDGSCAPQPTCPAIEGGSNSNLISPKIFQLCRVSAGSNSSVVPVLDKCPANQYCTYYVSEYGLCCPMPDKPFCPDGAKPGAKCDPSVLNQCGNSAYCNRYISPANDNSNNGYVCCPFQTPPPPIID